MGSNTECVKGVIDEINGFNVSSMTIEQIEEKLNEYIGYSRVPFWETLKAFFKKEYTGVSCEFKLKYFNFKFEEKSHTVSLKADEINNDDFILMAIKKVIASNVENKPLEGCIYSRENEVFTDIIKNFQIETINKVYGVSLSNEKKCRNMEMDYLDIPPTFSGFNILAILNEALKYYRYDAAVKMFSKDKVAFDDIPADVKKIMENYISAGDRSRMSKYQFYSNGKEKLDLRSYCIQNGIDLNSDEYQKYLLAGYYYDYMLLKRKEVNKDEKKKNKSIPQLKNDVLGREPSRYKAIALGMMLNLDGDTVENVFLKKGLGMHGFNFKHPIDYMCYYALSLKTNKYPSLIEIIKAFNCKKLILDDLEASVNDEFTHEVNRKEIGNLNVLDENKGIGIDDLCSSISSSLKISSSVISCIVGSERNTPLTDSITGDDVIKYCLYSKRANNPYCLTENSVVYEKTLKLRCKDIEKLDMLFDDENALEAWRNYSKSVFEYHKAEIENRSLVFIRNNRKTLKENFESKRNEVLNVFESSNKHLKVSQIIGNDSIMKAIKRDARAYLIVVDFFCFIKDKEKQLEKLMDYDFKTTFCNIFEEYVNADLESCGFSKLYYRDRFDAFMLIAAGRNSIKFFKDNCGEFYGKKDIKLCESV